MNGQLFSILQSVLMASTLDWIENMLHGEKR